MTEESFEDRLNRWTLGELKIELTKKNIYSDRKLNRIQTRIAELEYSAEIVEMSLEMKVFLSWSGRESHAIAVILRDWIPTVLPGVTTWVSSIDIDKGARWSTEIAAELEQSNYGIICLVPENLSSPWLNFEAGAISKSLERGRVAPLAVGLQKQDVSGPLAQFQITDFDKDDVLRLVKSINNSCPDPLDNETLSRNYKICWPGLEAEISAIDVSVPGALPPTTTDTELEVDDCDDQIIRLLLEFDGRDTIAAEVIAQQLNVHIARIKLHLKKLCEANYVWEALNMIDGASYSIDDKGREYGVTKGYI